MRLLILLVALISVCAAQHDPRATAVGENVIDPGMSGTIDSGLGAFPDGGMGQPGSADPGMGVFPGDRMGQPGPADPSMGVFPDGGMGQPGATDPGMGTFSGGRIEDPSMGAFPDFGIDMSGSVDGGMGMTGTADGGMGMTGSVDGGMGMTGSVDGGMGMTGSADGGMGMAGTVDGGMGMTSFADSGMGMTSSADGGMGMAGTSDGGMGMTRSVDGGMGMAGTGDGGMGMARSVDGGMGMAGTGDGGMGMARSVDGGMGMAGTGDGGMGMARSVDGGMGMAGTGDGGMGMARSVDGGMGMAGTGDGGMGMARSVDGGMGMAGTGDGGMGMARSVDGGMRMAGTGDGGMAMERSVDGGMGMAGTGDGRMGMTRSVDSGMGMAGTGDGGMVIDRSADGGMGIAGTVDGGMGMTSSADGGMGMARSADGGMGMTSSADGGMGMTSSADGGMGMTSSADGGMGMTSSADAGMGMTSSADGGMGMTSSTDGGMGMTSSADGGMGMTSSADGGMGMSGSVDGGMGQGGGEASGTWTGSATGGQDIGRRQADAAVDLLRGLMGETSSFDTASSTGGSGAAESHSVAAGPTNLDVTAEQPSSSITETVAGADMPPGNVVRTVREEKSSVSMTGESSFETFSSVRGDNTPAMSAGTSQIDLNPVASDVAANVVDSARGFRDLPSEAATSSAAVRTETGTGMTSGTAEVVGMDQGAAMGGSVSGSIDGGMIDAGFGADGGAVISDTSASVGEFRPIVGEGLIGAPGPVMMDASAGSTVDASMSDGMGAAMVDSTGTETSAEFLPVEPAFPFRDATGAQPADASVSDDAAGAIDVSVGAKSVHIGVPTADSAATASGVSDTGLIGDSVAPGTDQTGAGDVISSMTGGATFTDLSSAVDASPRVDVAPEIPSVDVAPASQPETRGININININSPDVGPQQPDIGPQQPDKVGILDSVGAILDTASSKAIQDGPKGVMGVSDFGTVVDAGAGADTNTFAFARETALQGDGQVGPDGVMIDGSMSRKASATFDGTNTVRGAGESFVRFDTSSAAGDGQGVASGADILDSRRRVELSRTGVAGTGFISGEPSGANILDSRRSVKLSSADVTGTMTSSGELSGANILDSRRSVKTISADVTGAGASSMEPSGANILDSRRSVSRSSTDVAGSGTVSTEESRRMFDWTGRAQREKARKGKDGPATGTGSSHVVRDVNVRREGSVTIESRKTDTSMGVGQGTGPVDGSVVIDRSREATGGTGLFDWSGRAARERLRKGIDGIATGIGSGHVVRDVNVKREGSMSMKGFKKVPGPDGSPIVGGVGIQREGSAQIDISRGSATGDVSVSFEGKGSVSMVGGGGQMGGRGGHFAGSEAARKRLEERTVRQGQWSATWNYEGSMPDWFRSRVDPAPCRKYGCNLASCYVPNPNDCKSYLVCQRTALGTYVATRMRCAFGSYWTDSNIWTCERITDISKEKFNCPNDPCRSPDLRRYPDEDFDNCRVYWDCYNGRSMPACCPAGQRFDRASLTCVDDPSETCREPCPLKAHGCGVPGAKKQPYLDGYCRTYWDCGKDGAPHPVCCPPGESFDPLSESCVKSGCNEACPSYFNPEPCGKMTAKGKPITSFESNDTNCRTFMKCDDTGVGVAYCCRSHYRYNKDTMSCEKIFDLDDPCLEAHCPHGFAEECRYDEVADPHQMFDIDAGIVRDCAPGTIFDKSICTCDYAPEPFRKGIQDVCRKEVHMKFDHPEEKWNVKNYGDGFISVVGSMTKNVTDKGKHFGTFDGRSGLAIWRYDHNIFGEVTLKITFQPVTVGTGGKQIIASNCQSTNFNGESSFEVALEPATSMITFTGRTDTDIAVLELQYQKDKWNTYTLLFDGRDALAMIEDPSALGKADSSATKLKGEILRGMGPLTFGPCMDQNSVPNKDGFVGFISEVIFAKCLDEESKNFMSDTLAL